MGISDIRAEASAPRLLAYECALIPKAAGKHVLSSLRQGKASRRDGPMWPFEGDSGIVTVAVAQELTSSYRPFLIIIVILIVIVIIIIIIIIIIVIIIIIMIIIIISIVIIVFVFVSVCCFVFSYSLAKLRG